MRLKNMKPKSFIKFDCEKAEKIKWLNAVKKDEGKLIPWIIKTLNKAAAEATNEGRKNMGGKREGAGRKNEGKMQVAFKLAPDVIECLRFERSKENPIAKIIEDLVREKFNLQKPLK